MLENYFNPQYLFYKLKTTLFKVFLLTGALISGYAFGEPVKVNITKVEGQYQLNVNDKPYVVKGAGLHYPDGHNFKALKQAGGNAFRTWTTQYADIELAKAEELGLMVLLGIDLHKELHGFDYNDALAVEKQFDRVKQQILKYKDHPNVLGWVVANEPNLLFKADGSLDMVNPKVYQAISDIIDFIHQVDPSHPVTYSFAGVVPEHINAALEFTPQVDFISVQVYGDLVDLQQRIEQLNIDKPFMVTEFGPLGHWERPTTDWGREIEEPSGVKARTFAHRIQQGIANNTSGKLIGHFAFEWGQKQERTPTWYGMFNEDGKATAQIDELTKFWTGHYPANRAVLIESMLLNNLHAETSVKVMPKSTAQIRVTFQEPNVDAVNVRWQLLAEVAERSQGGALELKPEALDFHLKRERLTSASKNEKILTADFDVPSESGEYRLFVYIDDGKGKVGNANFPFYVTSK